MAFENISPNMALPIPAVGQTSGTQYATDVNSSLTIIDGHTHTAGSGVQITPAGLNINSNLVMQSNSLTAIAALTLVPTASAAAQSIYAVTNGGNVDLYYIGTGTAVQITNGNSIVGATGTITGLSGTAGVAYSGVSTTYTFLSATAVAANIDAGAYVFRNISPNSTYGITLSPPAALGANHSLTLPIAPASGGPYLMRLDSSGNMGTVATSTDISSVTADAVGSAMSVTGADAIASVMDATGANAILATSTSMSLGGVPVVQQKGSTHGGLLSGVIAASGTTPVTGSGFTVVHTNGTGIYVITFSVAYNPNPYVPSVVVTVNSAGNGRIATIPSVNRSGFTVNIVDSTTVTLLDAQFSFMAM